MGRLSGGKVIKTREGIPITIDSLIGEGTQGLVYKVSYRGEMKALKWYKSGVLKDPDAFYDNLVHNLHKGPPDKNFLWPEAVTERTEDSFGYVMSLVPNNYKELKDLLYVPGGNSFKTFKAVVEACIRITSAFRQVHKIGYSYQDMNSGNFFINTATGDVRIGDTDNVAPNGTYTGIIGTPQYMAPEIVVGKSMPNIHTDEFSLAIVLFMLLCANHPLEGEHWLVPCLTPSLEKKLYGSDAVFIFDPENDSNRPVPGIHNNVLKRWDYIPEYVKSAFVDAFSQTAINDPNRRVSDLSWLKVLTRFQSDIVRCQKCGNEVFISGSSNTECDRCGSLYQVNNTIRLKDYSITAAKNTRIYKCQLGACNADEALMPIGLVVANDKNPDMLGLRNMTNSVVTGVTPSGKINQVNSGEIIPVKKGIVIRVFDSEIMID